MRGLNGMVTLELRFKNKETENQTICLSLPDPPSLSSPLPLTDSPLPLLSLPYLCAGNET